MTAPVTPSLVRGRARTLFDRDARTWAAEQRDDVALAVPLHPPTERAALADLEGARAWLESWRAVGDDSGIELEWATRRWSRVGTQVVPVRALVRGADAIALVAGASDEWRRLRARLEELRAHAGADAAAVLRAHARAIVDLDGTDFDRLIAVLAWLRDNPESGRLLRELPIRGIHTKWIESRRGLVTALHRAATGAADLGLREPSPLARLRALDPSLNFGGLTDISAPIDDLAAIPIRPGRVFVFENLATVLAMPFVPNAIAVHGGGGPRRLRRSPAVGATRHLLGRPRFARVRHPQSASRRGRRGALRADGH